MVDASLACLVLYLFADSFANMDAETCGDCSHMLRRLKKKTNKTKITQKHLEKLEWRL